MNMMKKKLTILVLAAGSIFGANAQVSDALNSANINCADVQGYMSRAAAMYADENYVGCIDQLVSMQKFPLTGELQQQAAYYMAMSALHCGDDEALEMLRMFVALYPQSVLIGQVRAAIGDYFFTRAAYGDALKAYTQVDPLQLTAGSHRDDLLYRTAYSRMMLGETDAAQKIFTQLSQRKGQYAQASKFYLAYIAYYKQDYVQARTLFEAARSSVDPGNRVDYYLCQLDFIDGNYSKAQQEAIELLGNGGCGEFAPELQRVAGESLYRLGNWQQSEQYLAEYVSAMGDEAQPSALYMLGVCRYRQGDYASAIDLLQNSASETDLIGQASYLVLGQSYARIGNINAATLAFEKASRLAYDATVAETATYEYIAARQQGGRVPFADTVGLMEAFINKYPNSTYDTTIRQSLADGYLSDSDYVNALRVLDQVKNPDRSTLSTIQQVLLFLGVRQYENGDVELALTNFRRASDMTNADQSLRLQSILWLAKSEMQLDQNQAAITNFTKYLTLAPASDAGRTSAYYNLGYLLMDDERYGDAYSDFMHVAADASVSNQLRADALNRAADCQLAQRRYDDAAALYARAYDANPQAGDYSLYQQAMTNGYSRRYQEKLAMLESMIRTFGSSPLVADAMLQKGETLAAMNRPGDAAVVFEQVADRYGSTAQGRQALLRQGMTLLNIGKTEQAADVYRHVVSAYPTSDEASVALADLKDIYASEGRLPDYVSFVNSVKDAPRLEISQFEQEAFDSAMQRYEATGSTAEIARYLKQFSEGANRPEALLLMAQEAIGQPDYEQAEEWAAELTQKYPDSPQTQEGLLLLAQSHDAQGKGEYALADYELLLKKSSDSETTVKAQIGLVQTAAQLGLYNKVIDTSAQLLSTSSASGSVDTDMVKHLRATALDRTGHTQEARALWEQVAQQPTTYYGSVASVMLIESLNKAKLFDQAAQRANTFIDARSGHNYWNARAFIAYSDVLRNQGKDFEADEYLKALRNNYPGSEPDIMEMIEERLK